MQNINPNPLTPFYQSFYYVLYSFIYTTKDRTLAYNLSKKLYRELIELVCQCGYQPAQDYLAEQKFLAENFKKEDKANTILDAIKNVITHIDQGRLIGLSLEEIITHDEIYGFQMDHFDEDTIYYAKQISAYMSDVMSHYPLEEGLDKVVEFIVSLRNSQFSNNWLADNSLALRYILAHAERLAKNN